MHAEKGFSSASAGSGNFMRGKMVFLLRRPVAEILRAGEKEVKAKRIADRQRPVLQTKSRTIFSQRGFL